MSFFVNTMVCGFSLYQILAFFLIYSCLGWCLEVIYAKTDIKNLSFKLCELSIIS